MVCLSLVQVFNFYKLLNKNFWNNIKNSIQRTSLYVKWTENYQSFFWNNYLDPVWSGQFIQLNSYNRKITAWSFFSLYYS